MPNMPFPRMLPVRQRFPESQPLDIRVVLRDEFAKVLPRLKPEMRIAVGVGSRGITNLQIIVREVLELLKTAGAHPFIIPAMGSHGGATPEGQREILEGYGVSEQSMGVPIRASMEVTLLGRTQDAVEVYGSVEALNADGIVLVNRVKPHTDFRGNLGSGLMKMLAIGLGKRTGAATCHVAASRLGYERVIRSVARVFLQTAPLLGGVSIVENQFHDTARIAVSLPEELEAREEALFQEACRLMPRLPFAEIDLLIVDRLGKNISGAGMDPNIIGRRVHGPSNGPTQEKQESPLVRRIFVRDLTPETHGNAIGIGLADLTTARLVRAMDKQATFVNALTSLTPHSAKIPIHFETDQEAVAQALALLALPDTRQAKIVRIADTLSLASLAVSEPYLDQIKTREDLAIVGPAEEMRFDSTGNLPPLPLHWDHEETG